MLAAQAAVEMLLGAAQAQQEQQTQAAAVAALV